MPERTDMAMVLGGASCVWEDVLTFEKLYGRQWDGIIIAANDVGAHWPREIHHWVTLHANRLSRWWKLREQHGFDCTGIMTWTKTHRNKNRRLSAERGITPWGGGSSGQLATQVAVDELNCRVVLCGVPMTRTPHFAETAERFHPVWLAHRGHWRAWMANKDRMLGLVKSMSGETQKLLGAPTLEWLAPAPEWLAQAMKEEAGEYVSDDE